MDNKRHNCFIVTKNGSIIHGGCRTAGEAEAFVRKHSGQTHTYAINSLGYNILLKHTPNKPRGGI